MLILLNLLLDLRLESLLHDLHLTGALIQMR